MRLRTLAAAAVTVSSFVALAAAQQQETPPVKIGFVDVERAVVSIDEGQARLKELQDWVKPRRDEINKLGSDVANLQSQIASERGIASDDAMADLNHRLVARQRELEDKQRDTKRDFDEKQQAVLKDLGDKLNTVIAKFADSNRYTAIFILKQNDVAYLANSADVTPTVIKLYNEAYPWPPAKPTAAK
jgi:outer membrane protein